MAASRGIPEPLTDPPGTLHADIQLGATGANTLVVLEYSPRFEGGVMATDYAVEVRDNQRHTIGIVETYTQLDVLARFNDASL